jgi:hypothetical protein
MINFFLKSTKLHPVLVYSGEKINIHQRLSVRGATSSEQRYTSIYFNFNFQFFITDSDEGDLTQYTNLNLNNTKSKLIIGI